MFLTSEEIFSVALDVIALVKKRTGHIPTAMRIMNAAKQGFNPDLDCQPPSLNPERPHEASVSRQESGVGNQ